MSKRKKSCKLCKVKRKKWEEKNFFGIDCNKHFVPMIVLKDHRTDITMAEKKELKEILKIRYPKLFPNYNLNCSDEHWHLHLGKKNGKTNTRGIS